MLSVLAVSLLNFESVELNTSLKVVLYKVLDKEKSAKIPKIVVIQLLEYAIPLSARP